MTILNETNVFFYCSACDMVGNALICNAQTPDSAISEATECAEKAGWTPTERDGETIWECVACSGGE